MPGSGPGMTKERERQRSSVAAVLAEQVELLLHRTVRKTEQHRIRVRLMRDPAPARHHEQIARAPLKGLVADAGAALAFDRSEYGGVGGAIARGLETLRQQLDEGADGRHGVVAGLGIGEFQLQSVTGIPLVTGLGALQRLTGMGIGIVEDRRGLGLPGLADRQEVVTVAGKAVAGGL